MKKDNTKMTVVGVDIAKYIFQVPYIISDSEESKRLKVQRGKFLAHLVNCETCLMAMQACSRAHHWIRELRCQSVTVSL